MKDLEVGDAVKYRIDIVDLASARHWVRIAEKFKLPSEVYQAEKMLLRVRSQLIDGSPEQTEWRELCHRLDVVRESL